MYKLIFQFGNKLFKYDLFKRTVLLDECFVGWFWPEFLLFVSSEREVCLCLARKMVVTYVCVYVVLVTSSLSVVSPLAKFVRVIKIEWWRSKMAIVEMCLRIRFLFAAWNIGLLLVRQDSWRVVSIETKLSYEMLRWQRVSSDVRGIVFVAFWRKTCCSCRNWTLDVTVSFVSGIWREYALSPLRWPRGELRASVSRAGLHVRST